MPSTVLYSSALNNAPNNVLVESCDVNEEASGLVRVGINYVCKGTDLETVSQTMVLDTEPPLYANAIFRNQLQRNRLYQYQRTYELEYGIGRIRAFYAGVLRRGQDPQVQAETETFNITFPLTVEDVARLGMRDPIGWMTARYGENFLSFWEYNQARGKTDFAAFTFSGRSYRLSRKFAALVNSDNASDISRATLEQMIIASRVSAFYAQLSYEPSGSINPTIPFDNNAASFENPLKEMFGVPSESEFLSIKTPMEWLRFFENSAWNIDNDVSVEYITPTVVVVSGTSKFVTTNKPARLPERAPASIIGLTQG